MGPFYVHIGQPSPYIYIYIYIYIYMKFWIGLNYMENVYEF